MATSKTTNTYNRQNWEDAVSIRKVFQWYPYFAKMIHFYFILSSLYFSHIGIPDIVSDVFRRQSIYSYGKWQLL